ncbi:aminopeptidase N-like [Phlebotomus papatasi]|nr:aminopeptidase N-like [Phlebotomus papatasi]
MSHGRTLLVLLSLVILITAMKIDIKEEKPYRLPGDIIPEKYRLAVVTHMNDDEGFRFTGKVWIKIMPIKPDVPVIKLHSKKLKIRFNEIKLLACDENSPKRTKLKVIKSELIPEHDFLVIHPEVTLEKGRVYELYIPFESELNSDLVGYYKSSYLDKKTKEKCWLSITQFEPTYARQAFPCFDEPQMKATFEISLAHDKKFTALSNMPIKWSEPFDGKSHWVWDHFQESVPMSTYLVAYSINDFHYKESYVKMVDDVVFKIWARPDAIDQVDYAKYVGPKVLKFYEDYFDIKFPLPKVDMIAIPDFGAGAMENFGLITYRETALLFQPNISSASSQHRVASVIAHELAHQWFGNLVTMKWWTDLWLNEGFATYIASIGVDHLHPEWNSFEEESRDNIQTVFVFDALKSSHPVSVPIGHPGEISQIFDAISYKKGSTILRMMHKFLGDEAFRNGVRHYLKKHKYNSAEQDDLWDSLTYEAHKIKALPEEFSVKKIMDSWTLQTGFPVITVDRDYEKGVAKVTQIRYLLDAKREKEFLETCWWVPLSYTTKKEMDFNATEARHWLKCEDEHKPVHKVIKEMPPPEYWVIFNVQLSGLYKVKYDKKNWDLLIDHLTSEKFTDIHTLNRAQLIDDALDLAWSGDQEYSIALRIVEYLKQEREYIPWKTALENLAAVNRMLKRTPQYGFFKMYMRKVLTPMYKLMGGIMSDKKASDRLDAVKHKILITSWACRFDVLDCREESIMLFKKWMLEKEPDFKNPIPLDMRSVVYCNAIRMGSEKEWNFLWDRYLKSNVGTEKIMILSSLACSREVWILSRYLEWSCQEEAGVRKQDMPTVFSSIAHTEVGYHLAKGYFYENFDKIYEYLGADTTRLDRFVRPLAKEMTTEKELVELTSFVKAHAQQLDKATQGVKQAIETVEINTQWQHKNYKSISRVLKEFTEIHKE